MIHFSNLQKKIFQVTILSLKFEFFVYCYGEKFKFQVQDSDLEYFFLEIRRFEKHIALSKKTTNCMDLFETYSWLNLIISTRLIISKKEEKNIACNLDIFVWYCSIWSSTSFMETFPRNMVATVKYLPCNGLQAVIIFPGENICKWRA